MFRRLLIAAVLATGLTGCITVYEYGADADSDDYYYSEPSIDHYDTGYGYGPYYERYSYSPYYDPFGYRHRSGWFGSIGYEFGRGPYGSYGYPHWYFGYGYGYGYGFGGGWSHYDPFWPYRYYGHDRDRHRRQPSHRPPHQRPPGEHRPPNAIEREDRPGRHRLQDLGRPVPEISSAPRVLNGSMPRPRPSEPDPTQSQPRVVMAPTMPTQRAREPRYEERNDTSEPRQMPVRRFEQDQDRPAFRPSPDPAPRPRPNASEREAGHDPK